MKLRTRPIPVFLVCLLLLSACQPTPRAAGPRAPGQDLVDQAADVVLRLRKETKPHSLDVLFAQAKGVVVLPALYRAGYIGGLEVGQGVLAARGEAGFYSEPAFLRVASGSVGLQIGIQRTSTILFLMSDQALEAATRGDLSLGTGASIAVLTWGEAHTLDVLSHLPDVYALMDPAGFFAGVSLNGAVLQADRQLDAARYGVGAEPRAILFERRFYAQGGAGRLQQLLSPFWAEAE